MGGDTVVELGPAATFLHSGQLVSFKELDYEVINSANKKQTIKLLSSVSGYLRPGELVALMGPSGSGKTTLLDVLAGRKTVGAQRGEILFGGTKPTQMFLRRFTGYVEQFDALVDILTVEEMLLYTAELKLPWQHPLADKKARVAAVIDALGLDTCRNVRIGSALARGISGGQAKRVNIGIALVGSPRVLFLDEPTTGLDSFTANEIMTVVQDLARGGITVCATIHSPTPYSFKLFDRLLMLSHGKVIYFGRNGEQVVSFFQQRHPHVETLCNSNNTAEWIVDVTTEADRQGKTDEMAEAFATSELRTHADDELTAQLALTSDLPEATRRELEVKRATNTPSWWQLRTLFKYRTSRNYTMGEFYGARVAPACIQILLIATIFWNEGRDLNPMNVTNVAALVFMWCVLPSFGAAAYTPALMLERPLFTRERSDGLYTVVAFLSNKILEETAINIPVSLIASVAVYYATGLQGSLAIFWLTFLVTWTTGITMSYFVAAMSPNLDVANAAVPAYGVINLFFAGFLFRVSDMGWWWRWYSYLNFVRWGFGAQVATEFAGDRDLPFLGGVTVSEYYSANWMSAWGYLGIEFIFVFVFLFLAWAALRFVQHIKR